MASMMTSRGSDFSLATASTTCRISLPLLMIASFRDTLSRFQGCALSTLVFSQQNVQIGRQMRTLDISHNQCVMLAIHINDHMFVIGADYAPLEIPAPVDLQLHGAPGRLTSKAGDMLAHYTGPLEFVGSTI